MKTAKHNVDVEILASIFPSAYRNNDETLSLNFYWTASIKSFNFISLYE